MNFVGLNDGGKIKTKVLVGKPNIDIVAAAGGTKDKGVDGGRGARKRSRVGKTRKRYLIVYSEKQAVVYTVMCTRMETKRKENCTGPWVQSRIYRYSIQSQCMRTYIVRMQ